MEEDEKAMNCDDLYGSTSSAPTGHLPHGGRLGGKHPVPKSPEEMQRETLGTIIRTCRDIERCAENMDVAEMKVHFGFLKTTIGRLDVIMTTVQQRPREL